MRPSSAAGLLLIAAVALAVVVFEFTPAGRAALCPHPVTAAGQRISCDGTLPLPDGVRVVFTSPAPSASAGRTR